MAGNVGKHCEHMLMAWQHRRANNRSPGTTSCHLATMKTTAYVWHAAQPSAQKNCVQNPALTWGMMASCFRSESSAMLAVSTPSSSMEPALMSMSRNKLSIKLLLPLPAVMM
jgi:hypothetical protein